MMLKTITTISKEERKVERKFLSFKTTKRPVLHCFFVNESKEEKKQINLTVENE